jgi:hypothetical protein
MRVYLQELRAEAKKEEQRLEEISAKEVQMQQRCNELQNEERHLVQRLEEISKFLSSDPLLRTLMENLKTQRRKPL